MVLTIRALVFECKFRITTLVIKLVDQLFAGVSNIVVKMPKGLF